MSNYSMKEHLEILEIFKELKARQAQVIVHRPSMAKDIKAAKLRLEMIKETIRRTNAKIDYKD